MATAACKVTGAGSRSCSALLTNRLGSTRATKGGGGRRDRVITCSKHQLELRATWCHEDNKRPLDYLLYTIVTLSEQSAHTAAP
jgi:hypothetical protein